MLIDIKNAFGSIPHAVILGVLKVSGIGDSFLTHSLPPKFIYPSSEAELKLKQFTYHTRLSPQSITGMGGSAMLTRQRVSGSECVKSYQ